MLKLIATPEEMLLERFKIMWPEGQTVDLQGVMSLKDMKRQEQQKLLELFGGAAAASASVSVGPSSISAMFQSSSVASLTQGLSSSAMSAFSRNY